MMDCISVENMRNSDAWTIKHMVSGLELMRRAAYGVFLVIKWEGQIAIVTGSGNNGGDGFALASILKEHGQTVTVFTVSQKMSPDSMYYADLAQKAGVSIRPYTPGCLNGYSRIVDCLLGTGFRGAVRDNYKQAICEMNTSGAYIVSVDINSGMNGDTGEAETAVCSDLTVTIGYLKNGLLSANAGLYMKRLVCADIGITLLQEENKVCDEQEWADLCTENAVSPGTSWIEKCGKIYYPFPSWLVRNRIRAY